MQYKFFSQRINLWVLVVSKSEIFLFLLKLWRLIVKSGFDRNSWAVKGLKLKDPKHSFLKLKTRICIALISSKMTKRANFNNIVKVLYLCFRIFKCSKCHLLQSLYFQLLEMAFSASIQNIQEFFSSGFSSRITF